MSIRPQKKGGQTSGQPRAVKYELQIFWEIFQSGACYSVSVIAITTSSKAQPEYDVVKVLANLEFEQTAK